MHDAATATTSKFKLSAATALHQGDRSSQQDQVEILRHPRHDGCLLAVVSDGMGGKSGGRQAADQVMLTAAQLFEHFRPGTDDAQHLLSQLVSDAHMLIRLTAMTAEQEPHATLAGFMVMPDRRCLWVHCGDSRIYHFRDGELLRRTRDHSYVQRLLDEGHITAEDAAFHPKSNLLLDCLGASIDPKPAFDQSERLEPGDAILACSDGVWPYFTDDEIGLVLQSLPPGDAVKLLIDTARKRTRGRGDNLSLALVRIG